MDFNLETLRNLTFERSKFWSNFINICESVPDDEDVSLSELDDLLKDHTEQEYPDADEAEEGASSDNTDVLHDITNRSEGAGKLDTLSLAKGARNGRDSQNTTSEHEVSMKALFDETMPILEEHERECREAGIYRVLESFDPKKIEEEVGAWVQEMKNKRCLAIPAGAAPRHCSSRVSAKTYDPPLPCSSSDSDSLHSEDTARYILSSRKHHGLHKKIKTCATMTIKTYRLMESKRESLREKYSCGDASETARQVSKTSRYCKIQNACLNQVLATPASKGRRKKLCKSRSRTSSANSSSSSTDNDCRAIKRTLCCRARRHRGKTTRSRLQYSALCCSRLQNHSLSSSSSFISLHSSANAHQRKKRHPAVVSPDDRPPRRESECNCYNEKNLCKIYKHLAESSTEEWMVENCNSSKKSQRGRAIKDKSTRAITSRHISPPLLAREAHENSVKQTNKTTKADVEWLPSEPKVAALPKKDAKKPQTDKTISKPEAHNEPNAQPAKEYNTDCLNATNKVKSRKIKAEPNEERNIAEQKRNSPTPRLPKGASAAEQAPINQSIQNVTKESLETMLRPQPKSVKMKKIEKMLHTTASGRDDTFFANTSDIRNSTAFSTPGSATVLPRAQGSNQAPKADGPPVPQKRARKLQLEALQESDGDCTIVSSTTGDHLQQKASNKSVLFKNTEQGILLYAPHDRTLKSTQQVQNGFFRITEEHLRPIVGTRSAKKFIKFNETNLSFNSSSTVYFRPPKKCLPSDSEDDVFDKISKYGELVEKVEIVEISEDTFD